jgi:very-short-patch-repair endonuclease
MDIPWQKIISYHKEITRRAEEDFFSLPVLNNDSDRWSSLAGFSPNDLSGPWELDLSYFTSRTFYRDIQNGESRDLYLGGPCYCRWKKQHAKDYMAFWQPLLYRAVKVIPDEAGILTLAPDQGYWEVSPLIYNFLENKSVCPEHPLGEIIKEILELAHIIVSTEGGNLTQTIIRLIQKRIPELGELLTKDFSLRENIERPSDWILFTPAESTTLNRNLMSDYNILEDTLKSHPELIGGLRLLVPSNLEQKENNAQVLPIIPLNDSQKSTVEGILEKKPVTVISGPPGCGKSQVVLSAILNSWAIGNSVLFASNNNQAVDVVRERLKPFEDIFPISIRAGARNNNNLQEVIRRIISLVSYGTKGIDLSGSDEKKKNELIQKKTELQSQLESKLPQIISQSVNSSIIAYAEYARVQSQLESRENTLRSELKKIGYETEPEKFYNDKLLPFIDWLGRLELVNATIAENDIKHKQLTDEKERLCLKRENILVSIGNDVKTIKWEWLLQEAPINLLKDWYEDFKALLMSPVEEKLRPVPWQPDFDSWIDSEDASVWVSDASILVKKTESFLNERQASICESERIGLELNHAKIEIESLGFNSKQVILREFTKKWIELYASILTLPNPMPDWNPFAQKNRYLAKIRKIETELRREIPVSIWRDVGEIDNAGRERLCTVIETIDKWNSVMENWDATANMHKELQTEIDAFNLKLNDLGCPTISIDWTLEQLKDTVDYLKKKIEIAKEAANALRINQEYTECKKSVEQICRRFRTLNQGIPIRESWLSYNGIGWKSIINKVLSEFDPQNDIGQMRQLLYDGSMETFINLWTELREIQISIVECEKQLNFIPADSQLISHWWSIRPGLRSDLLTDQKKLPKGNHKLFLHREDCLQWQSQWQEFAEKERPELLGEINLERERSLIILREVSAKIPDTEIQNKFMEIIGPVLSGEVNEWPTNAMSQCVEAYSPERIMAEIQTIDAKLETAIFNTTRYNRIEALRNDIETQKALENLYGYYTRNNGRLNQAGYDDFKAAFKALPIWITTALSTQAIPMLPEIFDLLIIDEATQCTLTNILPLIYRAKRIAVIGDIEQLPAIDNIGSNAEIALAEKYDIIDWIGEYGHVSNNVYNCIVRVLPRRYADVLSLIEHYRCHPLIIGFSNQYVYQQRLKLKKDPNQSREILGVNGMRKYDVAGICQRGDQNSSWYNEPEAIEVCNLISTLQQADNISNISIGVISPFRAQVEKIKQMLDSAGISRGVTVGTVHAFQGDQRDVILFSPVVSRGITGSAARWVETPRNLINVAVTRAGDAFFFVEDIAFCRRQPGILGELARYLEDIEKLQKTSLDELELFSWMVLSGWKPEIHAIIGDIEVDFILINHSTGTKVAVEVDGGQHKNTKFQDAARDAFLISQGYKVLRFSARDVRETPARVIKDIESSYMGQ